MKPDPKLIDSMALRYRHDFAFLDEQTKNSIRTTMTQLWEEVVGLGFYRYKSLYTQEEVLELLNDCRGENPIDISKWFEQFKKD
jgi:hypothetical protein